MGFSTREEFAVDENGLTADGYHRLAPVSKKAMYLANIILIVIVVAIFGSPFYGPGLFGDLLTPARVLCAIVTVVTVVYGLAAPQIIYRRYRYRIDDEKADLRRGVLFITHTMVPIERIHQVDVSRGPINRAFGLADVTITTAGGEVTIEHLEEDVAEDVAARLNQSVVRMLKERDRWKLRRKGRMRLRPRVRPGRGRSSSGTIRPSWRARRCRRSSCSSSSCSRPSRTPT